MNEKISIIVPVYKVEKYLNRCIESLINQSYKNIEIILINDGSPDKCGEICEKYAKKDKRIKVIHKENGGVSIARNTGIEASNGKYITFVDSDDYVRQDYILNMYNKIGKCCLLVENGIDFLDNKFYTNKRIKNDRIVNKEDFLKGLLCEKDYSSVCWGKLYKSNIVKKLLFNPIYRIAEDLDFIVRYLDICDDKIILVSNMDYMYNLNIGSAIRSGYSEKWNDEFKVCENLINKYKNTLLEIYAIKRFIRVNITCLTSFKLDKKDIKLIKNNIKKYKSIYMKSNKIHIKDKIKLIVAYYFYNLVFKLKRRYN